jgi:heparan-alpha-glucosaminide N-acetyltransferase
MAGMIKDPKAAGPRLAGKGDASVTRLHSLDVFRGFVIVMMIFVNYLAGVAQIPGWAKHMPDKVDGFTFVDLVFPGFLFMVGVSIPLAQASRFRHGDTLPGLLKHILLRTVSLLFLGVIFVNGETFSAEATGLSQNVWFLLVLLSVIAIWSPQPKLAETAKRHAVLALKGAAILLLAFLLFRYRGKNDSGQIVWLKHSWWGILGMIGWAYLNCSLIYLAVKGRLAALMGALGFLIALYIGGRHGRLDWLGSINDWVGVGEVLGSTSANVMAGVIVGCLFTGEKASLPPSSRLRFLAVFGVGLYLTGMLLRPLHGIIKNQATDSYTLVAAGLCCLAFLAFYWVIDVRRWRGWEFVFMLAGQNALLAYLLPDIGEFLSGALGVSHWLWPYHSGWPGALNTFAVTIVILLVNAVLTRAGLRLKM